MPLVFASVLGLLSFFILSCRTLKNETGHAKNDLDPQSNSNSSAQMHLIAPESSRIFAREVGSGSFASATGAKETPDGALSAVQIKISELQIAQALLRIGFSNNGKLPKKLRAEDLSFQTRASGFLDQQLKLLDPQIQNSTLVESTYSQRMENMLQAKLVAEEKDHFSTQAFLWVSLEALRQGNFELSKESAKRILQKRWASVQAHRWAFSFWGMAQALESKSSASVQSFQDLQNLHCKVLCSLPGWKAISSYDSGSLTPKGYESRVFSQLQFQMASQVRPAWLGKLFEAQKVPKSLANKAKPQESARRAIKEVDAPFNETPLQQDQRHEEEKERESVTAIESLIRESRGHWERNELDLAQKSAGNALQLAKDLGDEALILESSQVLFGRVGFETRSPDEITSQLKALNIEVTPDESSPLFRWIQWRISLLEFGAQNYESAASSFQKLAKVEDSQNDQARALYWAARSFLASEKIKDSYAALDQVGQSDPLSYYDVLAGGLFLPTRPMASSNQDSPFKEPVRSVIEKWVPLRFGKPSPLLSREFQVSESEEASEQASNKSSDPSNDPGNDSSSDPSNDDGPSPELQAQLDTSTASALLLATALRAGLPPVPFETFASYLRTQDTAFTRLLRSEALWQKQKHMENVGDFDPPLPSIIRVAWLLRLVGEYSQAIPYISQFRSKLINQDEDIAFLYFIYFPKPFSQEFQSASQTCGIESHVAYAVARQESLFQPNVVSPAGAVGIMQLMPATAQTQSDILKDAGFSGSTKGKITRTDLTNPTKNILLGSCLLANLLRKYNGNLALAAAAYNAGESKVDSWLQRRKGAAQSAGNDEVNFIEWIPYSETQNYVKAVVRNYALMNWIYGPSQRP